MTVKNLEITTYRPGILANMVTTQSIVSIGQLCAILQAGPQRVMAAAAKLGIVPTHRINTIPHYSEDDIPRLREYLDTERKTP